MFTGICLKLHDSVFSVLENYAKWQLLFRFLPTMSTEFSELYNEFLGLFSGMLRTYIKKTCRGLLVMLM